MAIDFDSLVLGPLAGIFGQSVTYTVPNTPSFTMLGVFDRAYVEVNFDDQGAPVSTTRPVLGVQTSAFPAGLAPAQGDTVTIGADSFEVVDTQPDSHGHVLLMLRVLQ